MPILGVVASSTRQGQATDTGAMFPLQVITLGVQGGVYFNNIPSTYKHLQLRGLVRANVANATDFVYTRINDEQGSAYNSHRLLGNGASAIAAVQGTTSYAYDFLSIADSGTSNTWTAFVMDVLDYANTNKYKTMRTLAGFDANGSGTVTFSSGLWMNTNAITKIGIDGGTVGLLAGSTVALYGIKGA